MRGMHCSTSNNFDSESDFSENPVDQNCKQKSNQKKPATAAAAAKKKQKTGKS